MIYKEIEFKKNYEALQGTERVYDKKGKLVQTEPDDDGFTKPVLKNIWKTIYKKGQTITLEGGHANDLIKLGYAKELEVLVPRKVKIPVDLKDKTDEIVKLGIKAVRNPKGDAGKLKEVQNELSNAKEDMKKLQSELAKEKKNKKPAPESNKKGKGPESNK